MKGINKYLNASNKLVNLTDLTDDYYGVQTGQKWKFSKILAALQAERAPRVAGQPESNFLDDIIKDFKPIITESPADHESRILRYQILGYNDLLHNGPIPTAFGNTILKIFGYKSFRNSTKALWFAKQLNVKACLYCNAQYTLTLDKEKKALFQFDHYFYKNKYPYLSLSMFNLVPSCGPCNITKSSKPFWLNSHPHPYLHDINELIEFDLNDTDVINFITKGKSAANIKITVKPRKKIINPSSDYDRSVNHIREFQLEGIYKLFTDVGEELFMKAFYYDRKRKNEIKKLFAKAGYAGQFTDSLFGRFVLGNYTLADEINKRPLSKMMKDIGERLKLIEKI